MTTTRQKLLESALQEFRALGWDNATGLGIRKRAAVSQGSWAHFFPLGKAEIAGELYEDLHRRIWGETMRGFDPRPRNDPAGTIRIALTSLFGQVEAAPELARLLFDLDRALLRHATIQQAKALRRRDHAALATWAASVNQDVADPLPGAVLHAIIFGSAIAFCTDWLNDVAAKRPSECIPQFVAAATTGLAVPPRPRQSGAKKQQISAQQDLIL